MAVIYLFVVLLIQDVMAVQQCDVESCAWKNIPDKAFLQCDVESCTPIKTPDKPNLRELPHFFDCSKLQFWNKELRIKNKACPARRPVYHCNYALEKYRYEELCWSFKIYLRKGERGIVIGGLHKWTCPIDRYQPFQSDSTIVNNCFYQKSLCTEEGQVPYRGHLPDQDRSCRCDYTKGYAFVVEPRNKCFCIPSEEDCSCYRKTCPNDNYNLTQDYDCLEFAISQNFNCSVIKENDIFSPNTAEGQTSFDDDIRIVTFGYKVPRFCIISTLIVILMLSGSLFLYDKRISYDTEDYKRKINTESEKNLCIRVMIVGKSGVGKTCLLRRLLEEDTEGVSSTDGIDIIANRCKIRANDGKWKIYRVASKGYCPVTVKQLLSEAKFEMRLKEAEAKSLEEKIQFLIEENKRLENELEAKVPHLKSQISEMSMKMGQLEEEKTHLEKKVIFLENQLTEADEEQSRQMEDQQKMYDKQLDRQMKEYDEQFSKNRKQHDKQLEELKKLHDEQLGAERNEIREQLAQQQKEQNELLKKFECSVQMNEKLLQQQQQEPVSGEKDKCTIS